MLFSPLLVCLLLTLLALAAHDQIAFDCGGWHDDDLVPVCTLHTLLGGGDSFSAGGPGKGMYSRLYREVLNQHYWVESCSAFTHIHSDVGMLGIFGTAMPNKGYDMAQVTH